MVAQGNTFNDDGSYGVGDPDIDSMGDRPKATLSIDPASIKGLEDYRPGDRVKATVEFMWPKDGQAGEDGMIEAQVISVKPEEMEAGAKSARGREVREDQPDLMQE